MTRRIERLDFSMVPVATLSSELPLSLSPSTRTSGPYGPACLTPVGFLYTTDQIGSGGWDRTTDRLLMRQPSYHCYTPPMTEATSFYAVPRSGESIDQRTKQRRRITRHTSVENCSWSLPAVTDVYLRGPGPQLAALCGSQRARCKTPGALSQWLTRTAGHPGRQPR